MKEHLLYHTRILKRELHKRRLKPSIQDLQELKLFSYEDQFLHYGF